MSSEEHPTGQKKGGLESLSHDELVAKCKTLLNIAQKAKKAKDDALEELASQDAKFKEELKLMREKVSADSSHSIQIKKNLLDLQLEYDTCQKEMGSLEEEHKKCNARIKKLENQVSIESDKRRNAEMLNNNLNEDLNKLSESSGQMRLICKRVMEEKEEIERDFKEIFQQKIEWTRYLQTAFPNESISSVNDWISILENKCDSKVADDGLEGENKILRDNGEELKRKVEKLENVIEDLITKKDGVSSEVISLRNDKVRLSEELNEVRLSRDTLLRKMDEVRIETTQLIENSEKLSEENGVLRLEKDKLENSFNNLSSEHLKSINDLKADNDLLVDKFENLKIKLEEVESAYNKLINDYGLLKSEKGCVDSRVIELDNCVCSLRDKIVELNKIIEENSKENSEKLTLSIENADIKKQLETLLAENAELADKLNRELIEREQTVTAVREKFDLDLGKYTVEIDNLRTDISSKENIIKELTEKLKLQGMDRDEAILALKNKTDTELSKYLVNEDRLIKDVANKEKIIKEIQLECESLKVGEETLRKQFEEQVEEKDRILNSLEVQCEQLRNEIEKLRVGLNEKEVDKDKVVNELQLQCDNLRKFEEKYKREIEEQNQEKDRIVKDLNEEVEKLRQCLNEKEVDKDKVVNELQLQCDNLRKVEEKYKREIEEQNQEKDRIVKDLNEEVEKLRQCLNEKEVDKDKVVNELQLQCDNLRKFEEKYKREIEEQNQEKDRIVKDLNEEVEKLRQCLNEKEVDKDKVVNELQLQYDNLRKVEEKLKRDIKEQNQEKEKFVEDLNVEMKKLNEGLNEERKVKNDLEAKCMEYENEIKMLKQRINERNQSEDETVNNLQSRLQESEGLFEQKAEELKKVEGMLRQKLEKNNEEKVRIVNDLNADCEKLRNEIDKLKQDKESQLVEHERNLEVLKSAEMDLIRRFELLGKKLEHETDELMNQREKSEQLSEKMRECEKSLNVSRKENEQINARLKAIEVERDEIEKKLMEKDMKIRELESEVEISEQRNGVINDTDSVVTDFFRTFLSSVNMQQSDLEDVRNYIDGKSKSSSESPVLDLIKLDNLLKTVCKVVVDEGQVKEELEKRVKVVESEKEVLKKEKESLESEKNLLEKREKKLLDKFSEIGKNSQFEKRLKVIESERDSLEKEKDIINSEKKELEIRVKELSDKIGSLEKDQEVTKLCIQEKGEELKKKLEEYEGMKSSLEECEGKLRLCFEEKKRTEEIIDDLKCETGKVNSLLVVVQQERDSTLELLHKSQLEKRDLESQVEKLRMEDEDNLHNLQDLNDRYLSMEEKLNFIFNENEELKGKVVELEEIHDNLLKEIENIVGNNIEVLSDTVVNDFRNKSVKLDSSILLKYLNEIISSFNDTIKEKRTKLDGLESEVVCFKKQLEEVSSGSRELKMLEEVLNDGLSGFVGGNIETKVAVLSQVVENSKFLEGLCESYAKLTGADLQEARKALKVELKDCGWVVESRKGSTVGKGTEDECGKKVADDVRAKEEEIVQLQDKNKELKSVAVKMKKKINDLNQLLDAEKQKVEAERTKLSQLSAVAKNAQMLQQECDRLADELEECKKTIKQLQKVNDGLETEHKGLQQNFNEKENRFADVEKEMAALKSQLESAVNKETSLVKDLEEVKTEKHVEEVIRKECEKELIITQDKLRKVQLELDQTLLESQKQTVLTQEKHDYEQQLSQSQHNLTQLESKLKEQGVTLAQLTGQLETERRDKDELAIQLTTLTAESQKTIETARIQNEALLNRVGQLEVELRTVTAERKRFEEEVGRLDSEFGAYKVRAQSVLRQKEQGGSSAEQEARDKCAQLQEMYHRTKSQLDSTLEELEQVKVKLDSVVAEKEALDKKCENINNILVQRNKELDRRMMEHRQHKLSTDTLIQCYKTQLEEKERGHQMELESLRLQLSKLSSRVNNSDVHQQEEHSNIRELADADNANFYHQSAHQTSSAGHMDNARHSPIDIAGQQGKILPPRPPLTEREDGEGSEGNEMTMFPGSLSNKTGLVPLAKLLSSSLGSDEERDVLSLEKFESLQTEMVASNARVKHLSALLSEAEKDSALMEEQNAVLKDEIRRLQRCIERQPHAHNVEYLKNVVFKFATLGSGDEKSRLVPVLDTILKLSPEEHKLLASVAKGETEQTSGWSSYLPTWQ